MLKKTQKKAFGISLAYIMFLTIYSNVLTQLYAVLPLPVVLIGVINLVPVGCDLLVAISGFIIIFILINYLVR